MSFNHTFTMKEEIGRGGYAIVYRCVNNATKRQFAVKVIKTNNMKMRALMNLESEARICRKLSHPNIVKLHAVYKEQKEHYFVFDLVTGGELFDDLASRESGYTEQLAAKCCHQLLDTLKFCHQVGVVHRDVKPENILLVSKEEKVIKVADFGLAVEVRGDEMRWFGLAGTPAYIAPEVLEMKPYGKPVDVWAIGVVLYIMLVGYQPFYHPNSRKLNEFIKTGDYEMSSESWMNVSEEAKDLVSRLLCVVPHRRLTADQALDHPWFSAVKRAPEVHRQDTLEKLRRFNARRKFKAAVHSSMFVQSFLKMKDPPAKTDKSSNRASSSSSSVTVVNSGNPARRIK